MTEYRATLMTHHLRAQPPDHPGAEAGRRHSIHHELGNYMTCHDRAFEQRFGLAVISVKDRRCPPCRARRGHGVLARSTLLLPRPLVLAAVLVVVTGARVALAPLHSNAA